MPNWSIKGWRCWHNYSASFCLNSKEHHCRLKLFLIELILTKKRYNFFDIIVFKAFSSKLRLWLWSIYWNNVTIFCWHDFFRCIRVRMIFYYSLAPKLWWKSWSMKWSSKLRLGLKDPKQATIHLALALQLKQD